MRTARQTWWLVLLSGALQVVIFPSPSLPWLAWVAVAPMLAAVVLAQRQPASTRRDFLLGYAAGVVWYGGSCYWIFHVMNTYGGLAAPVAVGVLVLFCLYLGLYHGLFTLLFGKMVRRLGVAPALALSPFLWVAVELARARVTGFPWDVLGTAQVDNIPLTRIATVAGVYGLSFAIMVVNAAFAAALVAPRERRVSLAIASVAAAVALQAGALVKPAPVAVTHSARLVQQNIPILDADAWTADHFDNTIASLVQLSRPVAGERVKPSLIVWPESPAPFFASDPKFLHWLSALATDTDSYVVAGTLGVRNSAGRGSASELLNSASLVTPRGHGVARYDKVHLVPWGEYVPFQGLFSFAEKLTREVGNFVPGAERTVFPLDGGGQSLGVFICYESIFPHEVREFAARGAQVFVNISNDGWFGETGAPRQHLNMARMRAIENNRWLLRGTNTGVTASIDPFGRVIASAPRNVRTAVDVPYAFVSGTTFYTRHGDLFAWACAIIAALALAMGIRRKAA